MARIETDPNYTTPTFSRATAATDPFKKEDVQNLAAAFSTHVHDGTGKGLAIAATAIPASSITSAMIVDGTITSADIADGTITSADIADATITNAKLGVDVARANLLTNGGFEIWQRGNGPLTTGYAADRWALGFGAGSSMSASRVASPNVATSSQYAMQVVYTHSAASTVNQKLDNAQLGGVTLTVSLMVKTATANAVRLRIDNTAGGAGTPGAYHPGDGTYRVLTVTQALPSTATDAFAIVEFNASCTAYLDNAMLVVGSQFANYAPLHPADDLARCQRYYKRFAATSTLAIGGGHAYGATNLLVDILMAPQLAVVPTLTVSAPGDWNAFNASASPIACTSLGANQLHAQSCQLLGGVASGLVAGNATWLQNVSGNSYIAFEANP